MKTLTNLDNAARIRQRRPGFNVLRAASAVQDGETFTFAGTTFEVDFSATPAVTPGRVRVDLSASGTLAAASRVLTFAGNPTAGDTVTIAGQVYTFRAALAGANDVLIGATLTDTRNNLVAAINAAAGAGTTYGTGTVANASVSATASSTDAVTATARNKGTAGNSITIAEAGSQTSWAGAATTLAGGVDATAAQFVDAVAALTNVAGVSIEKIGTNELLFLDTSASSTRGNKACTETLAGANNAWHSVTTYGNRAEPDGAPTMASLSRVPNAGEVALGKFHAFFDFAPSNFIVQVEVTATGAVKAWGGTKTKSGKRITLTNNGTNDFAATDTITIIAAS